VVGGGIVGLWTARALLNRYPGAGVVVLEREAVRGFKRLVPEVENEDLVPTAACGRRCWHGTDRW
jgi:glycine/D-amino acid oxidase-like deaminating enzyme